MHNFLGVVSNISYVMYIIFNIRAKIFGAGGPNAQEWAQQAGLSAFAFAFTVTARIVVVGPLGPLVFAVVTGYGL